MKDVSIWCSFSTVCTCMTSLNPASRHLHFPVQEQERASARHREQDSAFPEFSNKRFWGYLSFGGVYSNLIISLLFIGMCKVLYFLGAGGIVNRLQVSPHHLVLINRSSAIDQDSSSGVTCMVCCCSGWTPRQYATAHMHRACRCGILGPGDLCSVEVHHLLPAMRLVALLPGVLATAHLGRYCGILPLW